MQYLQQLIKNKSIDSLLKDVLTSTDLEIGVPDITNQLPIIIESINKGPISEIMPEETINTLQKAFEWHYSYFNNNEINNWQFKRVYTRTEKYLDNQLLCAYWQERKSNRVEFNKIIDTNKLSNYLNEFNKLGLTKETLTRNQQLEQQLGIKHNNNKLKSQTPYGIELTYHEINKNQTELTISMLLKTKTRKGLTKYFI